MLTKVLNHGHVRLVEHMGSDLSIVRNARVSYDAEWRTGADAGKDALLIDYLVRHGHTSPFECVNFTFDIKAPIFVFRQWRTHRTWSFNEVSARYTELPEEFYVPDVIDINTQSKDNKQMRTDEMHPKAQEMQNLIHTQCVQSFHTYHRLLKEGVPREVARGVLPLNTYSHAFGTIDLHNLSRFLKARTDVTHAQYEIMVYAEAMLALVEPIAPVAVAAIKRWVL